MHFERLRRAYGGYLDWALDHRTARDRWFRRVRRRIARRCSSRSWGATSFPSVDAGQIRFHVRAPPGTRIEETERIFARVEDDVQSVIPAERARDRCIDNIGLPDQRHQPGARRSVDDLVGRRRDARSSSAEKHAPTADYVEGAARALRAMTFPRSTFFFLAPDITTQVLNFGLSAPIDVQIVGPLGNQREGLRDRARICATEIAGGPRRGRRAPCAGRRPARAAASNVDRVEASQQGLTPARRRQRRAGLAELERAGRAQLLARPEEGRAVPRRRADAAVPDRLDGGARRDAGPRAGRSRAADARQPRDPRAATQTPVNITHYNALSTFDVLANVAGRRPRLGRRTRWTGSSTDAKQDLPRGTSHRRARPGREHERELPRARPTASLRGDRARLPAHGRQLPVVARPADHLDGAARRARRASSGCSSRPTRRSRCPR